MIQHDPDLEPIVKSIIASVFALLLVVAGSPALAETAFQLGVPGANAPGDPNVNGVRFSFIWGKNQSQSGLDLGLLSMSQTSKMSGLGLVLGISRVTDEMSSGAIFSLVSYHTGSDSGFNGSFINLLHEAPGAFNLGFVTVADGETMVDFGGFNMSRESTAQIGFVNVTKKIKSFQFGFLNMAENGFLPIFPIFNFPKSVANE